MLKIDHLLNISSHKSKIINEGFVGFSYLILLFNLVFEIEVLERNLLLGLKDVKGALHSFWFENTNDLKAIFDWVLKDAKE